MRAAVDLQKFERTPTRCLDWAGTDAARTVHVPFVPIRRPQTRLSVGTKGFACGHIAADDREKIAADKEGDALDAVLPAASASADVIPRGGGARSE